VEEADQPQQLNDGVGQWPPAPIGVPEFEAPIQSPQLWAPWWLVVPRFLISVAVGAIALIGVMMGIVANAPDVAGSSASTADGGVIVLVFTSICALVSFVTTSILLHKRPKRIRVFVGLAILQLTIAAVIGVLAARAAKYDENLVIFAAIAAGCPACFLGTYYGYRGGNTLLRQMFRSLVERRWAQLQSRIEPRFRG